MSDSNVGGRKNMSCINHIFVINGIIHETMSSKKNTPVTLQIYDYKQMFDAMNLKEAISDLYDSGMKDDTLALLYDANRSINVKVKTTSGLTAVNNFEELVLQGDTWGPTMAANQVDTLGKYLLKEQPEYIYKYKGSVPIGVLGMVDDLAGVSEHGMKAKQLNAYINVKSAEKKLHFGPDKCHTLTISHKSAIIAEDNLYIDNWSEKHDKEDNFIEKFEGKVIMKNVSEQKYLGFIISKDGSNMKNIEAKRNRALGIKKQIQFLLQGLGKYTFEGGMIYLNSLLRSSILFAAEAMYNTKENELRQIERIEEELLRKIFKTGQGCPIYQLYFESGHIPARFAIKRMKIVFLRYILTQEENSLMYQFLLAQKTHPRRNDWYSGVRTDLNEFEIFMTDEEIRKMPVNTFKQLVKEKSVFACINYLQMKQRKAEKGAKIVYQSLELQDYLNPYSNLSLEDQLKIFSLRTQMNPLKSNFSKN